MFIVIVHIAHACIRVCVWGGGGSVRARLCMLYPLRGIYHHHHPHHHLANMELGHLLTLSCLTRL